MNRFFKILFGNKANESSAKKLYTDSKFVTGIMNAEQIFELSKLFTEIPEYLESGNKQHISNAILLCKYCLDLSQLRHTNSTYTLTVLKYPKSSIYTAVMYILSDIEKSKGIHVIPLFNIHNIDLNAFYASLVTVLLSFDTQYIDLEDQIKLVGSASNKPLDDSLIYFKNIVNNQLPNKV